NASRRAARLAGSSEIANAGCVTSMTGNLRPSAVVANTMARLSPAGGCDCMTGSRCAEWRRHRGTVSYGAALPRYAALPRAVNAGNRHARNERPVVNPGIDEYEPLSRGSCFQRMAADACVELGANLLNEHAHRDPIFMSLACSYFFRVGRLP